MYISFYSMINVFCIIVLCLILYKLATGARIKDYHTFMSMIVCDICMFFTDVIWVLVEKRDFLIKGPDKDIVNFTVNCVYFLFSGLVTYFWFCYSEGVQRSPLVKTAKRRILCAIPFLALVLLTISSWKTGWIFYIENGVYVRGDYYIVYLLLTYGYVVYTSVRVFVKSFMKRFYVDRPKYVALSSFVIFPLLFGSLQIIIQGVPLICMGMTISILQLYINALEQMISIDSLTQLNNRSKMVQYLSYKLRHITNGRKLYLMVADVNLFKKINDEYGHIEGDIALVRVAEVLKQSCANRDYFVCRYGGDEFILICEVSDEGEVIWLRERIARRLFDENKRAKAPYQLTLSMGYTKCYPADRYIPDIIARADQQLYIEKENAHKRN